MKKAKVALARKLAVVMHRAGVNARSAAAGFMVVSVVRCHNIALEAEASRCGSRARAGCGRARHAMRGRLRSRPRQGLRSARKNRVSQADRSPLTRLFAPAVSTDGSRSA
jgi:hypothetical protein